MERGVTVFFRFFPEKVLRCLGQEVDLKTTFRSQKNIKNDKNEQKNGRKGQNMSNINQELIICSCENVSQNL